MNREVENQPPRPHPGKPIRETDLLRDPDINAAQSKAAGSPPHPTLHVRPGARLEVPESLEQLTTFP